MTADPAALRDQAREWGHALLAASPWEGVADRVTLLTVTPPATLDEAIVPGRVTLWLALDTQAARALPAEFAQPLARDEWVVRHHRPAGDAPATVLSVTTDATLDRLLQGTTRRSLEARWHIRHVEVIADRLRRAEQHQARAYLLPHEALERVTRVLWVDAVAAASGLDALSGALPGDALPAAGETAAALARLGCLWEDGAYPAAEYLRTAARETRIGRRIGPWLDDFTSALNGDEAALRRVIGSREQALEEVRAVLAEQFRPKPWLSNPEAAALRAPR